MIVNHLLVQMGQFDGGWCVVLCLQHSAQSEPVTVWQSLRKWPPVRHLWHMLVIFLLPTTSSSIAAPGRPILVHTGPDRPPWLLLVTRMCSRESLSELTVLWPWALEFFLVHACVWPHVTGGCLQILDDQGLDAISLSAHFLSLNVTLVWFKCCLHLL